MGISYVRGYKDPHMSLGVLSTVARTLAGVVVLRVPMHIPDRYEIFRKSQMVSLAFKLFGHILLIKRVARVPSGEVVIREFLTLPLLIISPLLFSQRKRLWFLCQHNVAFAAKNTSHRWALKFLRKVGFRFILFENSLAWKAVEQDEVPVSSVCAIPSPLPQIISKSHSGDPLNKAVTIGFVGNYRKEKSQIWALQALQREMGDGGALAGCSLLLGTSDTELRNRFSAVAQVIDTNSYQAYLAALRACDVVVFPYDPAAYAYRISGVLSDAVACGCAVVVPDIPILRDQVFQPALVGACYADPSGIVEAVRSAASLARDANFPFAIESHRVYRGKESIRDVLSALSS
jgi:glycosyltransferase involved in cell wall biosynthesis